ncbi:MAG: Eco57I restriction-modification methylase domain-containing protein [Mycobacterium leprae]
MLALAAGHPVPEATRAEVRRLAEEYRFFHWHLEFPHIFPVLRTGTGADERTGWTGGFSCVLGNPPWEHVELKEQEFFEARNPEIARASGAKRKRLIARLPETDPQLAAAYFAEKRRLDSARHFASNSERYPLTGRGRIKTDPLFAEGGRSLIGAAGRSG